MRRNSFKQCTHGYLLNTHQQYIKRMCACMWESVCVCTRACVRFMWPCFGSGVTQRQRWDEEILLMALIVFIQPWSTHYLSLSHTHTNVHPRTLRHPVGNVKFPQPPRVTSVTIWNLSNKPFNQVIALQSKRWVNKRPPRWGTGAGVCVHRCVSVWGCASHPPHPCCTPWTSVWLSWWLAAAIVPETVRSAVNL